MSAVVDINEGRTREVGGRKDADKQEQIIETGEIRVRASHLLELHERAKSASADYSEAIKAAAEASGLNASTVRSYIAAVASEQFRDRARKAQQLALVFDELGENPAQARLSVS
jgi:hypothetical protein